jgi:murein DD-endopeptidase MepM/ murein hydrolase activator NlpD
MSRARILFRLRTFRLWHISRIIGLLLIALGTACSTIPSVPEVQAFSPSIIPVTESPTATKTAPPITPTTTATKVIQVSQSKKIESSQTSTPTPVVTPTLNLATLPPQVQPDKSSPLEFTFPTPEPVDPLNWRPPLYPAPWALSEHDHFYFTRPISANTINWPLWNYRYGGTFPGWEGVVHTGIDIDAPLGTPVRAAAAGKVVWAGYGLYAGKFESKDPYGIAVTILHDFGFQGEKLYTIYAHMNEVFVRPDQLVNTGDVLGIVGETGATTGPHLHFEVRWKENQFSNTLNPELWVAPPQGWGVLVGRVMNTSGSFFASQDVIIQRADRKQDWIVRTYGEKYVRSDPYYGENLALSDLPAGDYIINIEYEKIRYRYNITIHPGAITYFRFKGTNGFYTDLPDSKSFEPPPDEKTSQQ